MKKEWSVSNLKILIDVLVLIVAGAAAKFLYDDTLVDWWLPVLIAIAVCIVSWPFLRLFETKLFPNSSTWMLFSIHVLFISLISYCLIMGINRLGADANKSSDIEVVVLKKYSEKHYRTRRLSRNRTVRGEPYYMYKVEVQFPDLRHKTLTLSQADYSKITYTSPLTLPVARGAFGWHVILKNKFY